MKDIGNRLIGAPADFAFEHRMLNFILILAIFMSFLGAVLDLLMWGTRYFWLIVGLIWLVMYYVARVKKQYKMISVISFTFLIFICFPYNWLINAGSRGPFAFYALIFIVIMGTILKGWSQNILIFSLVGVVLILLGVEYYFPGLITTYENQSIRFLDSTIHLTITMFVGAVLIIVYSRTYRREKERSDEYAETIEEYYRQQLYYMENLEEVIFKLKSERHDFNHRLGVIYGLLEQGEYDKLSDYTQRLVKDTEEFQNIVNIPYSMSRALLNYKLSVARDRGIELRLSIDVPPGLKINEFDLIIILGNLLDNAIKACQKKNEEDRYIDLRLGYKPDYLIISVKNPMAEKVDLERKRIPAGSTSDREHGFGLNNIEHLVKKHNGFMKIEQGDNTFRVNIALLVKALSNGKKEPDFDKI